MNYDSSDFAGGVPMNEPDAVRCCAPAASAYSDGIPAGYLDNPCIPAGSHNRSHKVMEHRKLDRKRCICFLSTDRKVYVRSTALLPCPYIRRLQPDHCRWIE